MYITELISLKRTIEHKQRINIRHARKNTHGLLLGSLLGPSLGATDGVILGSTEGC
jgi:hypothetical protein